MQKDGSVSKAKIELVFMSRGVSKYEVPIGVAGDIVQLTGVADAQIGETIADAAQPGSLANHRGRGTNAADLFGAKHQPV